MNDLFQEACPCCGQTIPQTATDSPTFTGFWDTWPHKQGKEPARKAWGKLKPADRTEARDKATAWCAWFSKQYPTASHMLPASYLNGRRWQDDIGFAARADRSKTLQFWAEWINSDRKIFGTVPFDMQRELVRLGMVTKQKMRERV